MDSNARTTSKWKAFPPDGGPFRIAILTADRKRKFEEKGWRFERTTLSDPNYRRTR